MSDKDKYTISDDEYQFPSDECVHDEANAEEDVHIDESDADVAEESYEDPRSSGIGGMIKQALSAFNQMGNKRIVYAAVVGVLALIVFEIFSGHDATEVVAKAPVAASVQQAVKPSPVLESQINTLRQDDANNQSAVNNLKGQVQQLQNIVKTTASTEVQVNQSVNALTQQVRQLSAVVKRLSEQPQRNAHRKKVVPVKKITYALRAIEPGRAWVQSSDGKAFSVRVGNKLKQYGTIQSIDPDRGLLLMSTGKVIGYGDNDS